MRGRLAAQMPDARSAARPRNYQNPQITQITQIFTETGPKHLEMRVRSTGRSVASEV